MCLVIGIIVTTILTLTLYLPQLVMFKSSENGNIYEFFTFEAGFHLLLIVFCLYFLTTIFNFNDYWKLKQEFGWYSIVYTLYLIAIPCSLYYFLKLEQYKECFLVFMSINVLIQIIAWNISIRWVVYASEHINYKLYMLSDLPSRQLTKYKAQIKREESINSSRNASVGSTSNHHNNHNNHNHHNHNSHSNNNTTNTSNNNDSNNTKSNTIKKNSQSSNSSFKKGKNETRRHTASAVSLHSSMSQIGATSNTMTKFKSNHLTAHGYSMDSNNQKIFNFSVSDIPSHSPSFRHNFSLQSLSPRSPHSIELTRSRSHSPIMNTLVGIHGISNGGVGNGTTINSTANNKSTTETNRSSNNSINPLISSATTLSLSQASDQLMEPPTSIIALQMGTNGSNYNGGTHRSSIHRHSHIHNYKHNKQQKYNRSSGNRHKRDSQKGSTNRTRIHHSYHNNHYSRGMNINVHMNKNTNMNMNKRTIGRSTRNESIKCNIEQAHGIITSSTTELPPTLTGDFITEIHTIRPSLTVTATTASLTSNDEIVNGNVNVNTSNNNRSDPIVHIRNDNSNTTNIKSGKNCSVDSPRLLTVEFANSIQRPTSVDSGKLQRSLPFGSGGLVMFPESEQSDDDDDEHDDPDNNGQSNGDGDDDDGDGEDIDVSAQDGENTDNLENINNNIEAKPENIEICENKEQKTSNVDIQIGNQTSVGRQDLDLEEECSTNIDNVNVIVNETENDTENGIGANQLSNIDVKTMSDENNDDSEVIDHIHGLTNNESAPSGMSDRMDPPGAKHTLSLYSRNSLNNSLKIISSNSGIGIDESIGHTTVSGDTENETGNDHDNDNDNDNETSQDKQKTSSPRLSRQTTPVASPPVSPLSIKGQSTPASGATVGITIVPQQKFHRQSSISKSKSKSKSKSRHFYQDSNTQNSNFHKYFRKSMSFSAKLGNSSHNEQSNGGHGSGGNGNGSTRMRTRIPVLAVLMSEKTYVRFMEHLTRELSTENLLFVTILIQFQEFLINYNLVDLQQNVKLLFLKQRIVLPNGIPKLSVIDIIDTNLKKKLKKNLFFTKHSADNHSRDSSCVDSGAITFAIRQMSIESISNTKQQQQQQQRQQHTQQQEEHQRSKSVGSSFSSFVHMQLKRLNSTSHNNNNNINNSSNNNSNDNSDKKVASTTQTPLAMGLGSNSVRSDIVINQINDENDDANVRQKNILFIAIYKKIFENCILRYKAPLEINISHELYSKLYKYYKIVRDINDFGILIDNNDMLPMLNNSSFVYHIWNDMLEAGYETYGLLSHSYTRFDYQSDKNEMKSNQIKSNV